MRRRPDLRLALLAVPVLALIVLLVLSSKSTPGAPSLPVAAGVTTTTTTTVVTDRGFASSLAAPKKVAADVPTVTAPDYGAASVDAAEVAWRNRAATIRAARHERQPWEAAVASRATALPPTASANGQPASPATNNADTTAERAVLTANQGGDVLVPFLSFAMLVGLVGSGGALAFRRRPAEVPS